MKRLFRHCIAALALTGIIGVAQAAFPERPVTIVVPYSPGGVTDHFARVIADKLGRMWGKPVVVENRGGGGTIIGTQHAAEAEADGHTLLLTSYGYTSNPILREQMPYGRDALEPLMLLGNSRNMLVLSARNELQSLDDVLAKARSAPGALSLASSGNASSPHIAAELFAQTVDAKITHVPYKGTAPAMNDVIGGQVDGIFDGPSAIHNVRAGKLRAIAIAAEKRHPAAAEVPTFRELGIDLVFGSWFGFFVPAGVPADIKDKLNADLRAAVADDGVTQKIVDKTGLTLETGSADDFARFLEFEHNRLQNLIDSGAKITVG